MMIEKPFTLCGNCSRYDANTMYANKTSREAKSYLKTTMQTATFIKYDLGLIFRNTRHEIKFDGLCIVPSSLSFWFCVLALLLSRSIR